MTSVACGGCGRPLVATPDHAGLTVKCAECGTLVNIPERAVDTLRVLDGGSASGRPRDAAMTQSGAAAVDPARDPRPALSGAVPDPVASGADDRSTTALALAAVSLVLPLLAPVALWYVRTAARQLGAIGGEEPTTLRHARVMARVGCGLLVVAIVCASLILIVIS